MLPIFIISLARDLREPCFFVLFIINKLITTNSAKILVDCGSGTDAQSPALVVADAENPTQLHKTLVP